MAKYTFKKSMAKYTFKKSMAKYIFFKSIKLNYYYIHLYTIKRKMDPNTQLKQLFHALPVELQEIIQRFTYKTQHKHLLNEIREWGGAKYYLQELTVLIDTANSTNGFAETTDSIRERIGPGLKTLSEYSNKEHLIKNWTYKSDFQFTEREHLNGEKVFRLLNWETSFAVYFWMCVYH